ncbi:MAG TPA: pitrilysin family protein [bacterium]|nr:pitrilysin family protein [bacterium]HPN42350.1 pitrilysin family protein [bacterium]
MKRRYLFPVLVTVALSLVLACSAPQTSSYRVPVEYFKLDNGLKVVLSTDPTAPIVTVAVYYNIGFRIEPQDRTGFAHLFEHMMFQGSQNLGKMEFIRLVQRNGGVLNGSTRFDFTNYFEIIPAHKLETALWAEADRMRGLDITQENLTNQQGVVVNEINQALHNEPYGGFPWLDMPQYANVNWYNAHNFYGDIDDVKAANLQDVKDFFKTFYAPNNTVLVITGDFVPSEARVMVQKYFGDIPAVEQPKPADLTEPRQETEKIFSKDDRLATKPALAFAYHMPERNTPQYYAMGLLDQLLLQGEDSRLFQALAKKKGFTDSVSGGINGLLGNMYNYNGPMLWFASLIYDNNVSSDSIMAVINEVIEEVRTTPVDQATLDHILTKLQSSLYSEIDSFFGFGRADLLACFALFDDDPARINTLEDNFKAVTPQLLLETAQEYLRPGNRTVLTINPKAEM